MYANADGQKETANYGNLCGGLEQPNPSNNEAEMAASSSCAVKLY